ncbi:MAG: bacteriohemerythrin [Nitrospinota bacterium]
MGHIQITWTEDLKTGLIWQDFQHQELFRYIANLRDRITNRAFNLEETKDFLNFYASAHFSVEEEYMKILNYTETESHIKEHGMFKEKLTHLYPSSDDFMSSMSLCNDLYEWIQNRVLEVDKKFASFVKGEVGKG